MALSGAASGVGVPARGAAPRLLRVARGTSPTRARPAHGHAPGHGARPRVAVGVASGIAEVLCFVYDDLFSQSLSACAHSPHCHSILRFFRRTVDLCPHCRTSLSSRSSGTRLPVAVLLRQLWKFCFMACCSATRRNHHALEMRLPLLSCVA